MNLIIDIPDSEYNELKGLYQLGLTTPVYKTFIEKICVEAIQNGTSYNPTGDSISREALKEAFEFEEWYWGKRVIETIDNAPTVALCYQTTSCLDCGNYDKENHNCPRFCEIIREAIKSRPQGEGSIGGKYG